LTEKTFSKNLGTPQKGLSGRRSLAWPSMAYGAPKNFSENYL